MEGVIDIKRLKQFSLNTIYFKVIMTILIMTTPLILLLIYSNTYASNVVRNQVADSYDNMMALYMNQIDNNLENTISYIHNVVALDSNFLTMEQTNSDKNYSTAKILMANELKQKIIMHPIVDSFFIYNSQRKDMLDIYNSRPHYDEMIRINNYFSKFLDESTSYKSNNWTPHYIDGKYYLIYFVNREGTYFGSWINLEKLQIPEKLVDFGGEGGTLFISDKGDAMTNKALSEKNNLLLQEFKRNDKQIFDDKHVLISEPSEMGGFSLVSIIPNNEILENIPFLQRMSILIFLSSIIVIPISFMILRKIVLIPLYRLVEAMKQIQNNNLKFRIKKNKTSDEYKLVYDTFNKMLTQIEQLKIEVYEEQINKQHEELQRLQLQINPHFFMNSLNILYSLAKLRDYELIKKMTLSLIRYFQFMFRDNLTFVELEDEINHTKNYLHIQELRYPKNFNYNIYVPDDLMNTPVPPLVIQTFIENSIKHAMTLDEKLQISIEVNHCEVNFRPYMKIVISDTGRGFSEDVLSVINQNESIMNKKGEHIGIWNVSRRLCLLYGNKAKISFRNNNTSGALVEILIPLD